VNSINLIGNLTRDPDARQTHGGTTVCNMRLAVSARGRGDPVYVDVVAFDRQAEVCDEHLRSGRAVAVSGDLGCPSGRATGRSAPARPTAMPTGTVGAALWRRCPCVARRRLWAGR
jgi:hypothetical protein